MITQPTPIHNYGTLIPRCATCKQYEPKDRKNWCGIHHYYTAINAICDNWKPVKREKQNETTK